MRIWQKTDICHHARTRLIKGHFREVRRYEKSLHCLHIAEVAGSIPPFLPSAFPTPTPRLSKSLSNESFHATCYAILENSKLKVAQKRARLVRALQASTTSLLLSRSSPAVRVVGERS